jgi:hypothetical protein
MSTPGIRDVLLGCAGGTVAVGCWWLWDRVRHLWPAAPLRTRSLIILAGILLVSIATVACNWKQPEAASTDVLEILLAVGLLLLYLAFAKAIDALWYRFSRRRGR